MGYYNPSTQVRLSAYADTIVFDHNEKGGVIYATRFGGYPEMVRAMAGTIYGSAAHFRVSRLCTRFAPKPRRSSATGGHLIKELIDVWVLELVAEDKNVLEVLAEELKAGFIQIPSAVSDASDGFDEVNNATRYYNDLSNGSVNAIVQDTS